MGLLDWFSKKKVKLRYDAALPGRNDPYWQRLADKFDPVLANQPTTRAYLVPRSRAEATNNGYVGGGLTKQSNFLVGSTGPMLRLQTTNKTFNRAVENIHYEWAKAILYRRKLWTASHAYDSDGDAFGMVRRNPKINHPVKMDWVLFETEMCQSQILLRMPQNGDGIDFDIFGNPEVYHVLKHHPGGINGLIDKPEQIPARFITHWFRSFRPGQQRGTPTNSPTLNLGAQARRMRVATLTAAETAAAHTVLYETLDPSAAGPELEDQTELIPGYGRKITPGWTAKQMVSEHPTIHYADFQRQLVGEGNNPLGMPVNISLGDSSQASYASARMDLLPWFKHLDVVRADCCDLVLDPLFINWWNIAAEVYGWSQEVPPHAWDWEAHPIIDREAEANANDVELKNGSLFHHQIAKDRGQDWDDDVEKEAALLGITPDELRSRIAEDVYATATVGGGQAGNQQGGFGG